MKENTFDTVKKKHDAPAFHYLFFSSDSVIKDICRGYQNVENNLQLNDETSFHAFSVTKIFTAVAIMQLVEQGKINLNDPVTMYLPAYTFSNPVTIKNLLCHQSGIANPFPLKWTHLASEHADFDYERFSNTIILNHLELKRSPGKKFAYSNINYLVLGRLIEEINTKKYQDYITDNILTRLPSNEYIGFDIPESNHASGYHPNTWFQNFILGFLINKDKMIYKADENWNGFNPFYINGAPYGGIISSPRTLMTFCQSLLNGNGVLLPQTQVKKMLTPQKTDSGILTEMCLGWFKGILHGHEYFCHAGGGGGYYSEIRLYPTLGLGSLIMMNSSGMKDDRILDYLDDELLKENELTKN